MCDVFSIFIIKFAGPPKGGRVSCDPRNPSPSLTLAKGVFDCLVHIFAIFVHCHGNMSKHSANENI